MYISLLQTRIF